jgi:hypothetical protein
MVRLVDFDDLYYTDLHEALALDAFPEAHFG